MSARFEGKTVIVTGGSSGIGQATAVAFANEGAKVIITGRRQSALQETGALHTGITGIVADVQSPDDARRTIDKAIELGGGLDVLVNNAGIAAFEPLKTLSLEKSRELFGINILGLITVTQAALTALTERKGNIVNISSLAGAKAYPGGSVYAATKAAVNSLTRSWAVELASTGVRVNAVAPGPIETPIFATSGMSEAEIAAFKGGVAARIPLGRMGEPTEIAQWVLHFADPASSWVTGQVLGIDGGGGA